MIREQAAIALSGLLLMSWQSWKSCLLAVRAGVPGIMDAIRTTPKNDCRTSPRSCSSVAHSAQTFDETCIINKSFVAEFWLYSRSPLWLESVEKVGVSTRPNFLSAVGAVFRPRRGGPSSSTSDATERFLNRSAAVIRVTRRCRWYFGRFAATLDLGLFQQNRSRTAAPAKSRRGKRPLIADTMTDDWRGCSGPNRSTLALRNHRPVYRRIANRPDLNLW
jgi:hypothetical protein